MTSILYKIMTADQWQQFKADGAFAGAPVDIADGFVHFSTAAQVRETAARHFAGQSGLMLVAIDATLLGEDLKYEVSRGGALFPHLYATLQFVAATAHWPMPLGADGAHVFPAEVAA